MKSDIVRNSVITILVVSTLIILGVIGYLCTWYTEIGNAVFIPIGALAPVSVLLCVVSYSAIKKYREEFNTVSNEDLKLITLQQENIGLRQLLQAWMLLLAPIAKNNDELRETISLYEARIGHQSLPNELVDILEDLKDSAHEIVTRFEPEDDNSDDAAALNDSKFGNEVKVVA